MKALQIVAPGQAEIVETPRPTPGPGEVLVEIEAVNTCPQWDLHLMAGEPMFPGRSITYPYTTGQPGHEAVGVVVETGSDVQDLTTGVRVAAWRDPGHDVPGSYAQYVVRHPDLLLPVPKEMPAQAVASLELATCVQMAFESLEAYDGIAGRRIGISGLGAAGLVAIQLARAAGASDVIGYDPLPHRRELATEVGADQVVDPKDVPAPESRWTNGVVDIAVDCAGNGSSVEFLLERTRLAVALFGVLRDDVRFGWRQWHGLALLGYRSSHRSAAETVLTRIIDGQLDLQPLVTKTLPLTAYDQGFRMLHDQQAIKICFQP